MRSDLNTAGVLCRLKDGLFLANGDNDLVNTICEVTHRRALPAHYVH